MFKSKAIVSIFGNIHLSVGDLIQITSGLWMLSYNGGFITCKRNEFMIVTRINYLSEFVFQFEMLNNTTDDEVKRIFQSNGDYTGFDVEAIELINSLGERMFRKTDAFDFRVSIVSSI